MEGFSEILRSQAPWRRDVVLFISVFSVLTIVPTIEEVVFYGLLNGLPLLKHSKEIRQ